MRAISTQLVVFRLGGQRYAVSLAAVERVTEVITRDGD